MKLSIICPTYNERDYIDLLAERFCADDGIEKEVLITDGGSTDGTRERVGELMKKYPNLKFVDNPKRTSTHAFNVAFKISSGMYVAFVGAHAEYDINYFKHAIHYLDGNECDAVGGPLHQSGKTMAGKAIALVMNSKMGVGNTEFRTMKKKMFVDSVAFAVYKREIFEKAGLMDESLPVNQDDEFHYRINKLGFKILMVPEMQATYYVRSSFGKLFRQYFRYGLYKPRVLKKVKGSVRLRHLIPSLFMLYFLTLPLSIFWCWWLLPLILYLSFIIVTSFQFKAKLLTKILTVPVYPILHISYGIGFIIGLFKMNA